jgi:hypothetical protein
MWWNLAQNPRVILAYYSQPPQLRSVDVQSVLLHHDGPRLEIVIDMPCFPDKPSPRWPTGANTVQARFQFSDLREISLDGWGTTNSGDLLVVDEDRAVRFQFDCPTARLNGLAGYFYITKITGYIKIATNHTMHPSGEAGRFGVV